jgi:hypothetical protein
VGSGTKEERKEVTISRFPFEAHIADMPPQHQYVIRNLWNVASDLQTAIPLLKSQIDTNTSSVKTVTDTVNNNTSTESVTQVVSSSSTVGGINNQTGNTTYSTAQADNGYFIIFDDASPVAVSLAGAPVIQLPWYCVIINYGVGLVTVTPLVGTITYPNNIGAASMGVPQGNAAIVAYDGTNYWAVLIQVSLVSPQNTPSIVHEWINAYDSATGVFSQTQPDFSDISGIAAVVQGGTGTTTPSLVAGTGISVSGSFPDQTVAISNTAVIAGSFTNTNLTVNAQGQITAASNGSSSGGVTQIVAGTNVTISPVGGTGVVTINASGGGGGGYPTVVASALSTTSYTGSYSWTSPALVTGAAYRLTVYVRGTTSGTGTVSGTFNFTPFSGVPIASISLSGGGIPVTTFSSQTVTYYSSDGNAITVSFSTTGTITYYPQAIVLERLG